jgi:hypothetical protein
MSNLAQLRVIKIGQQGHGRPGQPECTSLAVLKCIQCYGLRDTSRVKSIRELRAKEGPFRWRLCFSFFFNYPGDSKRDTRANCASTKSPLSSLTSRIKRIAHFIFENPEYGTKSMPRKSPANCPSSNQPTTLTHSIA